MTDKTKIYRCGMSMFVDLTLPKVSFNEYFVGDMVTDYYQVYLDKIFKIGSRGCARHGAYLRAQLDWMEHTNTFPDFINEE